MGRPKKRKVREDEDQASANTSNDTPPSSGERDTLDDMNAGMDLNGLDLSPQVAFDSGIGTDWGPCPIQYRHGIGKAVLLLSR
ncbi:hypothetical protein G7Z17_g2870 [Cylindrodendrum hubeiense]|uniref:Uncharacterized protein n=1 Tax=Cylindrodendrum hubeiense TaxID=595255 RepID=A0A9P5LIP7_9HYPO|nr:hypothetical protein G7Z17_g2870 [Cylindrodendrum hubeiense]